MLELFGTTICLAWCANAGLFSLIFLPHNYDPPSAEQTQQFARGFNGMGSILICVYVIELASDAHMRASLALHHLTAISLVLWGAAVIYEVKDVAMLRACFAVSLHMTTEQNVFLTMLAHRSNKNTKWPNVLYANAISYVATRVVITALCFWTWSDGVRVVWSGHPYSFYSYALSVFYPFASIILNVTQVQAIGAMFGIARKARKKTNEARKTSESAVTSL